jgi:hypothetical protein
LISNQNLNHAAVSGDASYESFNRKPTCCSPEPAPSQQ